MLNVQPSQYNPLDEPSPLGLRLRKSPSLLDLIQMTLSQRKSGSISENTTEITGHGSKKEMRGSTASSASDKLKASNFPASLLRIGSWEVEFLNTCLTILAESVCVLKEYIFMFLYHQYD